MKDREFNDNPYYSPEQCGLKLIDTIEADRSYEFDMVAIWQDVKSKRFYWDSDSGCSCPSPFEDVRRLSDLGKLNKTNFHGFQEAVENLRDISPTESRKLIEKWKRKLA